MIEFAAPGKAVIWGEYAVLQGAPALVMAVDRYARAMVSEREDGWHIRSVGFSSEASLSAAELKAIRPASEATAGATIRAALTPFDDQDLPTGAEVLTDTSTFYTGTNKLGIGSSAAVCTATCAALAQFLGQPFNPQQALQAHRALQGTTGSGLDVAASCAGGVIRFQDGTAIDSHWPAGLSYRFIWAGHSAKTTDHVARFNIWRGKGSTKTLGALCEACENLFDAPDMEGFRTYVRCLQEMDEAAGLGVYSQAHRELDKLANSAQVVYKPCGAGGGDIGIAVSEDKLALKTFDALAIRASFLTLDLEIAAHGVHQIRD